MWVKNYPAVKWAEIRYLREKVTSTRMPVVAKITIDITMTMTQTLRIDVLKIPVLKSFGLNKINLTMFARK